MLLATFALLASAQPPREVELADALRTAARENQALGQGRAAAQEAAGRVRAARAALLPAAQVVGSYARNSDEAVLSIGKIFDGIERAVNQVAPVPVMLDRSGVPGDTILQPLDALTFGASVRVPIFAGNAYQDVAAAKAFAGSAEERLAAIDLQIRAAVERAAWMAWAAEGAVEASERALEAARAHRESAARAVTAGTGTQLGVLRADTEVVRIESELASARAAVERAHLALGVLMGDGVSTKVKMPEPEQAAARVPATEGAPDHPELRALTAAVDAREAQVRSAWWRLLPTLSASFSAFASTVPYPTGESAGWRLTADLSWVLYDGGLRYGLKDQAEAAKVGAEAQLAERRLRVDQDLQDGLRELAVSKETLRLARRQVELASEAARTATRSFEAGLDGSLDVIDANARLLAAEVGVKQAGARLGGAVASLELAAGRAFAEAP